MKTAIVMLTALMFSAAIVPAAMAFDNQYRPGANNGHSDNGADSEGDAGEGEGDAE